ASQAIGQRLPRRPVPLRVGLGILGLLCSITAVANYIVVGYVIALESRETIACHALRDIAAKSPKSALDVSIPPYWRQVNSHLINVVTTDQSFAIVAVPRIYAKPDGFAEWLLNGGVAFHPFRVSWPTGHLTFYLDATGTIRG